MHCYIQATWLPNSIAERALGLLLHDLNKLSRTVILSTSMCVWNIFIHFSSYSRLLQRSYCRFAPVWLRSKVSCTILTVKGPMIDYCILRLLLHTCSSFVSSQPSHTQTTVNIISTFNELVQVFKYFKSWYIKTPNTKSILIPQHCRRLFWKLWSVCSTANLDPRFSNTEDTKNAWYSKVLCFS